MDNTTIATGVWPSAVLLAAIITAIATPLLLRAYRRATLRAMATGGEAIHTTTAPPLDDAARAQLQLHTMAVQRGTGDGASSQRSERALKRATWAHCAAGASYVLCMVLAWMLAAGDGFPVTRFLLLAVIYGWPLAITVVLVGSPDRGGRVKVFALYAIVLIAVGTLALVRNDTVTVWQVGFIWLHANLVPTLLWLGVLHYRIRAAGPLVLALSLLGVSASMAMFTIASRSDAVLKLTAHLGAQLATSAELTLLIMLAIPFALGVWIAIGLLRWLGRRYVAKRFSQTSLTMACLWLLFAMWQPITLVFEGVGYALAGPIGFLAYLSLAALLRPLVRKDASTNAPRVLLLRVFALDHASRALYGLLSPRLLRIATIGMITGPDLATTAIEPHEFLAFLGGRLSREFIASPQAICARLAAYDDAPDPDGSFRNNDFFCQNHTWQGTVQRLAEGAHAVVMDLRGFKPNNDGCAWEIGQLLERVDLNKVLMLTNRDTDSEHLARTVAERWRAVSANSPNVTMREPQLRLLAIDRLDTPTIRRIIDELAIERRAP